MKPKIYIKREREVCPILVATGKGISLTVASSRQMVPEETIFVPLKDLFLPVSIYWNPGNENPALKSLLGFVTEMRTGKHPAPECLNEMMKV
ncbi:MAG: hypothetical protein KF865_15110 [Bdellovibrionaceae bacterium]|nr:hypothetical protein [Pseudobdellovibrionaceae bacterium]